MLALLMSEAATSKEADRGGSPRLRPSLVAARECVQPAGRSDKRRFLPPATRLLPGYVDEVQPRGWRSLARRCRAAETVRQNRVVLARREDRSVPMESARSTAPDRHRRARGF